DIVIRGPGGEEALAQIPVAEIGTVATGEPASVVPDGTTTTLTGTTVAIGLLPGTGSSLTYPVTIALTGGSGLADGAGATVVLHPAGAATGLVVPTSALTARGRGYTVQVDRA